MTVIRLSDYACHSDIVNGCVKYNITNKNGNLIAVMNDRKNAKDYTRRLQQDYDRIQVQMHPERYGFKEETNDSYSMVESRKG